MRIEMVLVRPAPLEEAKRLYENWVSENPSISSQLNPDEDIRIDYIRSSEGTLVRYRIYVNVND